MAVTKAIYYRPPYQQELYDIKNTFTKAVTILVNPERGGLEKARAVYSLARLWPRINALPVPTIENTAGHNAHVLIGIRDRFFRRFKVPSRFNVLFGIANFIIFVYVTDFYSQFIDEIWRELQAADFKEPGPLQPDRHHFDNSVE